ncbi:MAG: sigma 54-interacting transcriptional regulator [Candidatus Tectomicrobia bacterium]|uniref:Sigma 54-interacting transcriptional regulator n=1 Tax=Tectimicrobiota bacterium TaxID=2528274 RepID=A0A933GLQ1_UNCTE|nr:sigma 54-interacting transcriptional regulator [Candidatus Tectomicrobia bacterium]
MKPSVLLVDDDQAILFSFSRYLTKAGYVVKGVSSIAEGKEALSGRQFDAIVLDMLLPDGNGVDWIPELRSIYPQTPVIIITAAGDIPEAVKAMRLGAENFLTKPVKMAELDFNLKKSLELGEMRKKYSDHHRMQRKQEPFFGNSPASKKVKEKVTLAAESDAPVLILGETGVGKGVLARWIHDSSSRSKETFVEINCSTLKGDLLASGLFGHIRGAFTGAVEDKEGLIEVANGGTLFLDEIGEMDLGVQAQLLKVIEEKTFRRIGETKIRRSEFRLLCASNRDIRRETEAGRFRIDLYYRINLFPISVPPLRERPEDIGDLVNYLLKSQLNSTVQVSPEAMEFLKTYPWPGNVRELKNFLERSLLLSKGQALLIDHFPGIKVASRDADDRLRNKWKLPRLTESNIMEVLKKNDDDAKKAAQALGISRATFYRKLKEIKEKDYTVIESLNEKFKSLEGVHISSIVKECRGDTKKAAQALGISRATLYRKLKDIKEKDQTKTGKE